MSDSILPTLRQKVHKEVLKRVSKISAEAITHDLGMSRSGQDVLAVYEHFIYTHWILRNVLLCLLPVEGTEVQTLVSTLKLELDKHKLTKKSHWHSSGRRH